jgi:Uncharacterized enzyme of heme biosynthesis
VSIASVAAVALAIWIVSWRSPPRLEPLPAIPAHLVATPLLTLVKEKREEVERAPRSAAAWGALGSAMADQCDREAQICFRNAERLEPQNYRWPYLQGACSADHDFPQALACFSRAAELAPDRPHVQLRLADFLLSQGDLRQAQAAVDRARSVAGDHPRVHLVQARLLFASGKFEEALVWAENSAGLEPATRDTHVLLAQLYRRLKDPVAAERELAILSQMQDFPTNWDDPDVAAVSALQHSARDTDGVKASVAGDDQDPTSVMRQAQKYIGERRYSEAEALIREAVRSHPDDERLRFQLGIVYFQQNRFEEAAHEFRRVSQLKPDHSETQYNLGHSLLKLNRPAEAKEAFAAAVRLRPGYANARINLAELLLSEGRAEEAREQLRVALRIAPTDSRAQQLLERANGKP